MHWNPSDRKAIAAASANYDRMLADCREWTKRQSVKDLMELASTWAEITSNSDRPPVDRIEAKLAGTMLFQLLLREDVLPEINDRAES